MIGRSSAPDKLWDLKPHTRTKHLILKLYLQAWLPIMASYRGQILIIDGFAGRGRYSKGEEGSPLLTLRTLKEHPRFQTPAAGRKVLLLFIERRVGNAKMLQEELARFAQENDLPAWIIYDVKQGDFVEHVNNLLTSLKNAGVGLPPTFAFVDPHGYRVPLDMISRLLNFPRCECLINFMYKFINRATHRSEPQIEQYLDELFGTPAWRHVRNITEPEKREQFLVDLYKSQLMEKVNFKYVRTFQMIDGGNRTEYFLFFGTRNAKGLSQMKKAMWKADPEAGQIFSDRTDSNQMVLIQPAPNLNILRNMLQIRFGNRGWVSIRDVQDFVLFDTPYSEELHLKMATLKPMEIERLIEVRRPRQSPNRPGNYPPPTMIRFN